jgi:hypothetical protein
MLASSPSSFSNPSPFALRRKDSYVHQRELESQFCRDLVCCNQPIADLHELLQHYEEQHVDIHANNTPHSPKVDEDEDDDDEDMEEDEDDTTHGNLPILLSSQDMSALEHEGGVIGGVPVDGSGGGGGGGGLGIEHMDFSHFGTPTIIHPGN